MAETNPIGVFDSGYGGLTVMKELLARLPGYDYLYLGDNARTPYGNRSFETVYQYTWQCVQWFFRQGCPLVILACNTASAKALRSIQQKDLPTLPGNRRVLGVIRPSTEVIGRFSKTGKLGILATRGTVASNSYPIEIARFFPGLSVYQQACPMWVPLVENNEYQSAGGEFFVKQCLDRLMARDAGIDTLLLACTHYPLLLPLIKKFLPPGTTVLSQGSLVADSLADYLQRHPEMEQRLSRQGLRRYYTTDSTEDFDNHATIFSGEIIRSLHTELT